MKTNSSKYDSSYIPYDISGSSDQPVFTGKDNFSKNCNYCRNFMKNNADIIMRTFTAADGRRCAVVFCDGMSNKDMVERNIILASRRFSDISGENKFIDTDDLIQQFGSTECSRQKSLSQGYISALTGDVLLIIEDEPEILVIGYRAITSRSVGESSNEGSVTGPHEAFTENFRTNTGLLRRRISDPNLVIEHLKVGQRSHTTVALCYIRGVTNSNMTDELRRRIQNISIDIINDSGELAQLIEDDPKGLFPQSDLSELPDAVAGELCNGRAAIIVSGSPQVLILPGNLSLLMRVREDAYQRWSLSSFVKILRWLALIIAVTGPSLYVAMIAFHPGLLPTNLLMISAINRLNVPFSALIEVLIIEFFLELLREASIRMPSSISTALSIVGGLIIGDAAISAGLISPLLVIIIGLTTMSGFIIPSYSFAASLRLIKYLLLFLTALIGLPGLLCGIILWISMMVKTTSYGTDFTVPFSPPEWKSMIHSLIQFPAKQRTCRPDYLYPEDNIKQSAETLQDN